MKVEVKMTGLDGVLDTLRRLPPEVVSKRGGPVRRALAKGARLIRDQARANVRAIVEEPNKDGRPSQSTGALAKAIIATRGKPPAGMRGERYIVWLGKLIRQYANTRHNVRKQRVGKEYDVEPPQFYGRFLEYGTSRMRPHPWLRPAFEANAKRAIETIETELIKDIDRIVRKLAKK